LYWAYTHARGRRDLLVFRAQLRNAPSFELEALDPKAWMTNRIVRNVRQKNWARLELGSSRLCAYFNGNDATTAAKPLIDLAERAGGKMVRLSVRRTVPNLEVHCILPDLHNASSHWFSNLRQIGEATMR
jgi:hypothetical protein